MRYGQVVNNIFSIFFLQGYQNDITILYIEEGITFRTKVQPVCLTDVRISVGSECWVTGWGLTETGKIVVRG